VWGAHYDDQIRSPGKITGYSNGVALHPAALNGRFTNIDCRYILKSGHGHEIKNCEIL